MANRETVRAKIELHPTYQLPRRLYDNDEPPTAGKPRQIAEAFLGRVAGELGIQSNLGNLKFDQAKPSLLGTHVLFQQVHGGRPVTGAWVRVDIDPKGRVFNLQNDLIPERAAGKAKRVARGADAVSERQAKAAALKAIHSRARSPHRIHDTERVTYPLDGRLKPAWKVVVVGGKPRGEWKVYVDAATGEILRRLRLQKDASGRVFDPNPVVALNDSTLMDSSPIPDTAYVEVDLPGLATSGRLDGPFVSTAKTAKRIKRKNGEFRFKRPSRAFKEVMVYFHIDRVQRYIQELGFDNVMNWPIKVNVHGAKADNSFYSYVTRSLSFGRGGVDDAEDAEIILHEYGHAIQDDQVRGFGSSTEASAMGEGFGDYLSASFFADRKPARLRPCVGTWDAVAHSGDDPPALRRLDSNKKYPRDMQRDSHVDGELWSACLWQIRAAMGGREADRLIIAHHFLLTPRSSFEDAAHALITTDQRLSEGRNAAAIREVFVQRGILPNPRRKDRRAGVPYSEIHRAG